MDELIAYYPWLAPQAAGANDPHPHRAPGGRPTGAPAAVGTAPAHSPPGARVARGGRRRAAPRSGDSLLPLLFAA